MGQIVSTPIHTNNPHTNFGLIPEAFSGALDGFPPNAPSKCTSTKLYTICVQLGSSTLTLLNSERPKLYIVLAYLSAVGLTAGTCHDK